MNTPKITSLEMSTIEEVMRMGEGYVLNFNNRTFAMFFADFGIDIDEDFSGSKATRLRRFLLNSEPDIVVPVLDSLLERRLLLGSAPPSPQLEKVKNLIARLRGTQVSLPQVSAAVDVLSLAYVHELEKKTDQRLSSSDLEGAMTTARTMLEAVLLELERKLTKTPGDYKGDIQRLFKTVSKMLRMDDDRNDLDDNFKMVVRGLVQIVHGLAPIRNKMSDGHPRERKPAAHHTRFIVNAAKTVVAFLIESYLYQREKGMLPSLSKEKDEPT